MLKKVMYIAACVVVLITNNGTNTFRKGLFIENLTVIENTVED